MTVTYCIQNCTPDSVKLVMIRKFFQMVFVGNDRKSLHIYTATVLGGKGEKIESSSEYKGLETKYLSELNRLNSFCMKFGFTITGNDNNDVVSITSEDVTDGNRGFLSQIDCIRRVWGGECEIVSDDQKQLNHDLRILAGREQDAGEEQDDTIDNAITSALVSHDLLWIEDKRKAHEPEMTALAIPGAFSTDEYPKDAEKMIGKKPEGSERSSYRIQVPNVIKLTTGIELVNWVKTTIRFKGKLRDTNFNYCIKKEMRADEKTHYIAPDFTWYFSPSAKSRISNESSIVEIVSRKANCDVECKYRDILKQNEGNESDCGSKYNCVCPIKQHFNVHHATTAISNAINPVANKTTVNFTRWTKDEQINYRQKYRLASKNVLTPTTPLSDVSEINIFLDLSDEHGRGNRQFILSIFISFALAFGVDTDRLIAARNYFFNVGPLNADLQWLLLLTFLSLNLFIRPPHTKREQRFHNWRVLNIAFSSIWVLYVFIFSGSNWGIEFSKIVVLNHFSIYNVMKVLLVAFILSDFLYAAINIFKFHDPILSGIFQDDIL